MCLAYIIPLLKGNSLDPTNPSNYRGNSVGSVWSKLFESVLLNEFLSPLFQKLHDLQGGLDRVLVFLTPHLSCAIVLLGVERII